jgi:hypothetical protein
VVAPVVVVDASVVLVVDDAVVVDSGDVVVVVEFCAKATALHHPRAITTKHSRAAGRRMIDPQEALVRYGRYAGFVRRRPRSSPAQRGGHANPPVVHVLFSRRQARGPTSPIPSPA